MIYCTLEPGLVSMTGLQSHETEIAWTLIDALIIHKSMIRRLKAKIPFTDEFVSQIWYELDNMPIKDPPIQEPLKSLIIELLGHQWQPSLAPLKLGETQLIPDVISPWIPINTRDIWIQSFTAAIAGLFEGQTNDHLTLATWPRKDLPYETTATNTELTKYTDCADTEWCIPVISRQEDWLSLLAIDMEWPDNLEILMEDYARKFLGIPIADLNKRLKIRFDAPCLRAIRDELDNEFRKRIVEVISCRAYNRLQPYHHNEKLIKGEWRIRVKKMTPAIRLHYTVEGDELTFTLYSNGDHDKGLK